MHTQLCLCHIPQLTTPPSVGQYLRLLKSGTDLLKVKKSKTLPRVFRLEEDLLAVAWNSNRKSATKARSKFSPTSVAWDAVVNPGILCVWGGGGGGQGFD